MSQRFLLNNIQNELTIQQEQLDSLVNQQGNFTQPYPSDIVLLNKDLQGINTIQGFSGANVSFSNDINLTEHSINNVLQINTQSIQDLGSIKNTLNETLNIEYDGATIQRITMDDTGIRMTADVLNGNSVLLYNNVGNLLFQNGGQNITNSLGTTTSKNIILTQAGGGSITFADGTIQTTAGGGGGGGSMNNPSTAVLDMAGFDIENVNNIFSQNSSYFNIANLNENGASVNAVLLDNDGVSITTNGTNINPNSLIYDVAGNLSLNGGSQQINNIQQLNTQVGLYTSINGFTELNMENDGGNAGGYINNVSQISTLDNNVIYPIMSFVNAGNIDFNGNNLGNTNSLTTNHLSITENLVFVDDFPNQQTKPYLNQDIQTLTSTDNTITITQNGTDIHSFNLAGNNFNTPSNQNLDMDGNEILKVFALGGDNINDLTIENNKDINVYSRQQKIDLRSNQNGYENSTGYTTELLLNNTSCNLNVYDNVASPQTIAYTASLDTTGKFNVPTLELKQGGGGSIKFADGSIQNTASGSGGGNFSTPSNQNLDMNTNDILNIGNMLTSNVQYSYIATPNTNNNLEIHTGLLNKFSDGYCGVFLDGAYREIVLNVDTGTNGNGNANNITYDNFGNLTFSTTRGVASQNITNSSGTTTSKNFQLTQGSGGNIRFQDGTTQNTASTMFNPSIADLDMDSNDILQVNNINTININGSAYPPPPVFVGNATENLNMNGFAIQNFGQLVGVSAAISLPNQELIVAGIDNNDQVQSFVGISNGIGVEFVSKFQTLNQHMNYDNNGDLAFTNGSQNIYNTLGTTTSKSIILTQGGGGSITFQDGSIQNTAGGSGGGNFSTPSNQDLDMNTNDILQVGNINLSTINQTAYPPPSTWVSTATSVLNMDDNDILNIGNMLTSNVPYSYIATPSTNNNLEIYTNIFNKDSDGYCGVFLDGSDRELVFNVDTGTNGNANKMTYDNDGNLTFSTPRGVAGQNITNTLGKTTSQSLELTQGGNGSIKFQDGSEMTTAGGNMFNPSIANLDMDSKEIQNIKKLNGDNTETLVIQNVDYDINLNVYENTALKRQLQLSQLSGFLVGFDNNKSINYDLNGSLTFEGNGDENITNENGITKSQSFVITRDGGGSIKFADGTIQTTAGGGSGGGNFSTPSNQDLDMNTNDILQVGNINLSTINQTAYPPPSSWVSTATSDLNMSSFDITNVVNVNGVSYPPPSSFVGTATGDLNMSSFDITNVSNINTTNINDIQARPSNTYWVNEGVNYLEDVLPNMSVGDVCYISSGSFSKPSTNLVINKTNVGIIAPNVHPAITEFIYNLITIQGTQTRIANLQFDANVVSTASLSRFDDCDFMKNATFTPSGYLTINNCEFVGTGFTLTIPFFTSASAVLFTNCNFSGITFVLNNPSPLQVYFNNCIGFGASFPTNATFVGINSKADLSTTTTTNSLTLTQNAGGTIKFADGSIQSTAAGSGGGGNMFNPSIANLSMSNFNITNVEDIDLTTINGAAYPPPSSFVGTATGNLNMSSFDITNVVNVNGVLYPPPSSFVGTATGNLNMENNNVNNVNTLGIKTGGDIVFSGDNSTQTTAYKNLDIQTLTSTNNSITITQNGTNVHSYNIEAVGSGDGNFSTPSSVNLDMDNNSILQVGNINLSTINLAPYPPPSSWVSTATSDLNMAGYKINNVENVEECGGLTGKPNIDINVNAIDINSAIQSVLSVSNDSGVSMTTKFQTTNQQMFYNNTGDITFQNGGQNITNSLGKTTSKNFELTQSGGGSIKFADGTEMTTASGSGGGNFSTPSNQNLDMNTNDILQVGNINLSTINSSAYPPPSSWVSTATGNLNMDNYTITGVNNITTANFAYNYITTPSSSNNLEIHTNFNNKTSGYCGIFLDGGAESLIFNVDTGTSTSGDANNMTYSADGNLTFATTRGEGGQNISNLLGKTTSKSFELTQGGGGSITFQDGTTQSTAGGGGGGGNMFNPSIANLDMGDFRINNVEYIAECSGLSGKPNVEININAPDINGATQSFLNVSVDSGVSMTTKFQTLDQRMFYDNNGDITFQNGSQNIKNLIGKTTSENFELTQGSGGNIRFQDGTSQSTAATMFNPSIANLNMANFSINNVGGLNCSADAIINLQGGVLTNYAEGKDLNIINEPAGLGTIASQIIIDNLSDIGNINIWQSGYDIWTNDTTTNNNIQISSLDKVMIRNSRGYGIHLMDAVNTIIQENIYKSDLLLQNGTIVSTAIKNFGGVLDTTILNLSNDGTLNLTTTKSSGTELNINGGVFQLNGGYIKNQTDAKDLLIQNNTISTIQRSDLVIENLNNIGNINIWQNDNNIWSNDTTDNNNIQISSIDKVVVQNTKGQGIHLLDAVDTTGQINTYKSDLLLQNGTIVLTSIKAQPSTSIRTATLTLDSETLELTTNTNFPVIKNLLGIIYSRDFILTQGENGGITFADGTIQTTAPTNTYGWNIFEKTAFDDGSSLADWLIFGGSVRQNLYRNITYLPIYYPLESQYLPAGRYKIEVNLKYQIMTNQASTTFVELVYQYTDNVGIVMNVPFTSYFFIPQGMIGHYGTHTYFNYWDIIDTSPASYVNRKLYADIYNDAGNSSTIELSLENGSMIAVSYLQAFLNS